MTYSSGGLIQATDYNGFASTTAGANVNDIWATGATDKGYGQTALSTVSAAGTVTATQWAGLVNNISSMASHTGTTVTARTAPVAGNTISIFAALNTDLTNITANRGNAAASGTTSTIFSGTTSKTTSTQGAQLYDPWTITITHTVTFASANAARYFFNAGGLIRLDMSKTSTGTTKEDDWNAFAASVGVLYLSGRVISAAQTIAGSSYTGFTRVGGSGSPTVNATTTGWYTLSAGAAATTMFNIQGALYPYTGDYIRVTMAKNAGADTLTIVTTWYDAGDEGGNPGQQTSSQISGGTATNSPYSSFGTAPAVLCRYVPPSSTYLSASWGTPTVAASVA